MKLYPAPTEAMFRDLLKAEIEWLQALSDTEKKLLSPHHHASTTAVLAAASTPVPLFPVHQCACAGEMALVLLRVKPCCTVVHFGWKDMGRRYFEELLEPWATKYQLQEHGFSWELTPVGAASLYEQHDDTTTSSTTSRSSRRGDAPNFGSAAMFRDLQSTHANLVDSVFHRTANVVSMEELKLCFGYPSSVEQRKNRKGQSSTTTYDQQHNASMSKIYYQFENAQRIFPSIEQEDMADDDTTICAPCLEYDAHCSDASEVGSHFLRYRTALLQYGISIALDMDQQEKWSNEDIYLTWWAASGRDTSTWVNLVNQDVLWNRLPQARFDAIRQLVAARAQH